MATGATTSMPVLMGLDERIRCCARIPPEPERPWRIVFTSWSMPR